MSMTLSAPLPPSLAFRGRILSPQCGYTARPLLELEIRATIGAILNKSQWWTKWRRTDTNGEKIRDKWLLECEHDIIATIFKRSTSEWHQSWLGATVPRLYAAFPTFGTDQEKRAYVDQVTSTVPYNLIWDLRWWEAHRNDPQALANRIANESEEAYRRGNETMASFGQIVWYFELVLLHESLRQLPLDHWQPPSYFHLGTEPAVSRAIAFIRAVRRGDVAKQSFAAYVPTCDHRPRIVEALWYHVDRILQELAEIRSCITKTLDDMMEKNRLDADAGGMFVLPGPVEETWMSDLLINDKLKHKFVSEVKELESVPENQKDWHPESNYRVLDLVHPSLYCCVFGTTKCTTSKINSRSAVECMQRAIFSGSQLVANPHRGSAQYQWIPSDFAVASDGAVDIRSYINNLHPLKHQELYESIACIFQAFVPMFDNALSCLLAEEGPLPAMASDLFAHEANHLPAHPRIPDRIPFRSSSDLPFSLRGRTVQVIVKIAEIQLTPENPSYAGGAWHVEGSDAEQIVATGIYYFGCDNITESRLSFRVIVQEPEYQQDDRVGLRAVYGLVDGARLVQSLGSVTAVEDRCVVFPNTLQHRVEPFELVDSTQPGVRKILAFFIVDPTKSIPSTAVIPPQQAEWIRENLDPLLAHLQTSWTVPEGILDTTVANFLHVGGMMPDEAKQHRLGLMAERKPMSDADDDDEKLFFSLCEH